MQDGLGSRHPGTFKKLKWKLTFAILGFVALGFALLAILGLFDLQRTSAEAVETKEWRQLQRIVKELQDEAGARAVYAQVGKEIQGRPSEEAFLHRLEGLRPRLEPLPDHVPRALWGRASCTVQEHGKDRRVWIAYRNSRGLQVSTRWENGALLALSIE